jgi:hypothetical protein
MSEGIRLQMFRFFGGTFQRIFVTKLFLKKKKKGCFAPLCVPLGLKKPGHFTMSKGIRLQMFRFFGGWVWSEGKKKGRHGRIVSDRHGHPLVLQKACTHNGRLGSAKGGGGKREGCVKLDVGRWMGR